MERAIRVVRSQELEDADPTPGMHRQRAFESPPLWAGQVTTDPGATSGWHHHGGHETSLYIIDGAMRLEFGAGGHDVIEAGPGDFVHVPAHVVHRESNPADRPARAVIARTGDGAPTINVDGPSPED